MRAVFRVALLILTLGSSIAAAGVREFDLDTKNRLGRQLINPPPSNSGVRARAKQTALTASKGMLFKELRYSYAVLDDPDGNGFLVYALAGSTRPNEMILGGHIRVTVSADGMKAERVDDISQRMIRQPLAPSGVKVEVVGTHDPNSQIPAETYIYTSDLHGVPIFIGPAPGVYWCAYKGWLQRVAAEDVKDEQRATESSKKR